MEQDPKPWCSVTCLQRDTKHVKTIFETHGWFNKSKKISKYIASDPYLAESERHLSLIPTMLSANSMREIMETTIFETLNGERLVKQIIPDQIDPEDSAFSSHLEQLAQKSPLHQSLLEWAKLWGYADKQDNMFREKFTPPVYDLLQDLPVSYNVYQPMLLLPSGSLSSNIWKEFLIEATRFDKANLFSKLAGAVNCTHIAINAHIPAESHVEVSKDGGNTKNAGSNEIRSPVNLSPLLGDFGPVHYTLHPTAMNFDCAFWVQAKQNGIKQTWAPRYSMFSRGNIKEKARLLGLVPKTSPVTKGDFTAVDLYAGIGYFAFSYARAGASRVLCWELNGWSVEGLRRGASLNGWLSEVVHTDDLETYNQVVSSIQTQNSSSKLILFHEDNASAASTISQLEHYIPPIRHVNCGLLPTSEGSWSTAVKAISERYGGWIHLHENIRTDQIVQKSVDICMQIQKIVNDVREHEAGIQIKLEHVEQVKSYAPGVKHCVLDIFIPSSFSETSEGIHEAGMSSELNMRDASNHQTLQPPVQGR